MVIKGAMLVYGFSTLQGVRDVAGKRDTDEWFCPGVQTDLLVCKIVHSLHFSHPLEQAHWDA